ncbi:MAG: FG-GAP repeat protein [Marinicellaceae bacterium]
MKTFLTIFILFISTHVVSQDWELVAEFAPDESSESDYGSNMVFAGDKLVVSWPRIFTRGNDADSCGEIITYEKVAGSYQELSRLTAEDLTGSCVVGDGFGYGLAYDNGKLAIGMPAGARSGIGTSGAGTDADSKVFITTFESDNWVLEESLTGSDLGNGKGMGFQLVMEGDMLLVGAHEYDSIFGFSFVVSAGVYVFENSGSGFIEQQKLEQDFHLFGQDFDYENDQIIVGAWGEQMITEPGRIYIYENSGASWEVVQTINDTRNANLGNQIEIFENTMAAGNVQAGGVGAVTIYTKSTDGQWSETQFIQASDNTFNDQFGISLKLREGELIVGAGAGQDSMQTLGAVYTFVRKGSEPFVEQQKLVASNPTDLYDRFGGNLIFNDTDLLVNSNSGGFINADATSFHHFSRESSTGETEFNISSKVSGTWVPEGAENQNLSIEILTDGRAVMFANLNNAGESLWMLGVGIVGDDTIDFPIIYTTSGAVFGNEFDSSDVDIVNEGQAMIRFNQCDASVLTYDFPNIETSEINLNKDMEIPGNECDENNKALPNGISGSWFDPTRAGEGFTVYLFDQGDVQMATITWYTYDDMGQQLGVSGTGSITNNTIDIAQMIQYTGANLFNGATTETVMGSLSMTWDDCRNAVVNYDFDSSNLGTGEFNLNQLTVLDNTACDL